MGRDEYCAFRQFGEHGLGNGLDLLGEIKQRVRQLPNAAD